MEPLTSFHVPYLGHAQLDLAHAKPDTIPVSSLVRTVLCIGMIAMLLMGVYMGPFYTWASEPARPRPPSRPLGA